MEGLDLHAVEEKLNAIAEFLSPCLPLANGHATDFITKKYWDTFLPKCIQDELLSLTKEQLNSLPCAGRLTTLKKSSTNSSICTDGLELDSHQKDRKDENNAENNSNKCCGTANELQGQGLFSCDVPKFDTGPQTDCTENSKSSPKDNIKSCREGSTQLPFSSITDYCAAAEACTIAGLGLAVTPDMLLEKFDVTQNDLFVGTFMSEKKSHEIEVMSKVCSSIAKRYQCKLVIDFGSGKGYLGKHLSLLYNIPVLGIDAIDTYTQSAEQRSAVLDKQWRGLTRNAEHKLEGKKLSKKEKKLYRNKDKIKNGNKDNMMNTGTRNKERTNSKSQTVACIDSSKDISASNEMDGEKSNRITDIGDSHEVGKGESNSNTNIVMSSEISYNSVDTTSGDIFEQTTSTALQSNFVPCTCYIDENTDFMQLADKSFPHLFSSICIDKKSSIQRHNFSKNLADDCNINCSDVKDKKITPVRECVDKCDCSHDLCKSFSMKCTSNEESMCIKCISNKEQLSMKCTSNKEPVSERLQLMLVGLHTCGNLASTSVELFVNNDQLSVLCNVGCCYHLIDEMYAGETAKKAEEGLHKKSGFPLSMCLNQKKFSVGNTARNLASQAVYRVPEFDQLQGERFYPRALLEVILQDVEGETREPPKGLRGLEKKSKSTKDYLRRACDKLNISDKISDETLDVYMSQYQHEIHRLAAFFQLKTVLAPCIESLIILDRVVFLLEQDDIDKVYLVKMFDPVISPRCYAIVAIKK